MGFDNQGRAYFYFNGVRLYRQLPSNSGDETCGMVKNYLPPALDNGPSLPLFDDAGYE